MISLLPSTIQARSKRGSLIGSRLLGSSSLGEPNRLFRPPRRWNSCRIRLAKRLVDIEKLEQFTSHKNLHFSAICKNHDKTQDALFLYNRELLALRLRSDHAVATKMRCD